MALAAGPATSLDSSASAASAAPAHNDPTCNYMKLNLVDALLAWKYVEVS